MPLMNAIRYTFLKSPVRILHHFRRNIVSKKNSNWTDFLEFTEADKHCNFERIQNSKLTPKGFEVIYVTPMLNLLKWNYVTLPFCWSFLGFDTYMFFKNSEDYIAKMQERHLQISYKDKIFQTGILMVLILTLHLVPSRAVVATFRKENEFLTLLFGFLGPLTKSYVPHGFKAMEPTAQKAIYNFKGKKVLLWSNGFHNFKDFNSVVALKNY